MSSFLRELTAAPTIADPMTTASAGATTEAKPLTIMRIAWGVFLGNLFFGILGAIIYGLFFFHP